MKGRIAQRGSPSSNRFAHGLQLTDSIGKLVDIRTLHGENPYKAPAGTQTDQAIHERIFGGSAAIILPYSTDQEAALRIPPRLKALYGYPVETGETKTRPRRYFARFNSGPSTATEVLADTLPLAICRLALVLSSSRDPATSRK